MNNAEREFRQFIPHVAQGIAHRAPVDEYLSTSYTPDVNFLDGYLEERNVGTKAHGTMTCHIANLLDGRGLAPFIETRLRINATRFRVPDVCA